MFFFVPNLLSKKTEEKVRSNLGCMKHHHENEGTFFIYPRKRKRRYEIKKRRKI
jgi:hypothetical protein